MPITKETYRLPLKGLDINRFSKMGFQFIKDVLPTNENNNNNNLTTASPLFITCKLPTGWRIRYNQFNSSESYLMDDKGKYHAIIHITYTGVENAYIDTVDLDSKLKRLKVLIFERQKPMEESQFEIETDTDIE